MVSFTSTLQIFEKKVSDLLFDMLLSSMIRVRATRKGLLWIVSPWFSDITFNFVGRSTLSGLFPSTRRSIKLSEILTNFLDYGGEIRLVCRPPHSLVNIEDIRMLTYIENASFPRKDLIVYKVIDSIVSQKSTIDFILKLLPYVDSDKVKYRFSENLHAKIFMSENYALTGSSNITYSGLLSNLEFNCVITDTEGLKNIKQFCDEIWNNHAVCLKKYVESDDFRMLIKSLEQVKDKFDPRLKDLYIKLRALEATHLEAIML